MLTINRKTKTIKISGKIMENELQLVRYFENKGFTSIVVFTK